MARFRYLLAIGMSVLLGAASEPNSLPSWAYPMNPPGPVAPQRDDPAPQHLQGSGQTYTRAQIRNLYSVPDWFPDTHPPMPTIVAEGRKPASFACGYCHLPNGLGRPENAGLAFVAILC